MTLKGITVAPRQAAEKGPSAAFRSPQLTAAYNSYASFAGISRALHMDLFEQPALQRVISPPLIDYETGGHNSSEPECPLEAKPLGHNVPAGDIARWNKSNYLSNTL
jgi:hypothetical protein